MRLMFPQTLNSLSSRYHGILIIGIMIIWRLAIKWYVVPNSPSARSQPSDVLHFPIVDLFGSELLASQWEWERKGEIFPSCHFWLYSQKNGKVLKGKKERRETSLRPLSISAIAVADLEVCREPSLEINHRAGNGRELALQVQVLTPEREIKRKRG